MSTSLGLIGIVLALAFMTFAVYRNWSILYCSIISVVIITLTNKLSLYEVLSSTYINGFSGFAAPYFILFLEGAMLGKLYDTSGAAWRLGKTIVTKCGKRFALLGYLAVVFILEYGGISTFVICFVLLPLARPIFKETGTPWYLWPAFTLVPIIGPELMMPGGLQAHNIIPTKILGTKLTAAPAMGIFFVIFYSVICALYLIWESKRAQKVDWKLNSLPPIESESAGSDLETTAPHTILAIAPMLVSIVLINFFGLAPIYGMGISVILSAILFYKSISPKEFVPTLNTGAANGVMPLIMVAAVVGIAKVVASTGSFIVIRDAMLMFSSTSKIATGLSVVGITNMMALICGSASGAISMTLEMFKDTWLSAGLPADWIHRVVTTAAGGFDTTPWNSFIVLMLALSKLDHRRSYMPIFWVSLVAPIITALTSVFFL